MARFRIRTNWTNSVSETYEFVLEDLAEADNRDRLKWAMSDPERLRPGESRQALTGRAAATFSELAQSLRERGHDPQAVAHFVNRLVFCMFAEDVGLLPDNLFTRMLEHARRRPEEFADLARDLFGAMSTGGRIGFEAVAWFNGGLFDDDEALPLDRSGIDTALKAAALDWSEIDPSIFGTLFERGLDPDKRPQLGAHYTDRDKIMRIVDPVVVRPLLAERESLKSCGRRIAGIVSLSQPCSKPQRPRFVKPAVQDTKRRVVFASDDDELMIRASARVEPSCCSKRGGGEGAEETHTDQSLQRWPAMARRRPRRARWCRGRSLWLGPGDFGRRGAAEIVGV